jgi:outer membrane protein assembly factor BamE (lipoprotein component of BamABCDE complex)
MSEISTRLPHSAQDAPIDMTMRRTFLAACCLSPLWLAACAGYAPSAVQVGHSAQDVVRSMGPPTGQHALRGGGTRLEFARGPYGRHTYMVDLDAAGRVSAWSQVLSERNFNELRPGVPREDVLRALGRPSQVRYVGWRTTYETWAWRYESPFCQWFQVSFEADGKTVRDTAYGPDPLCDRDDSPLARLGRRLP